MGEDGKSARTQMLIAILGLVGVLGAPLITQRKNIFPSHSQDNTGIVQKPASPPQQTTPSETKKVDDGATAADAERLTANYFASLKKGDAASIIGMTSVPYLLEENLLVSKDDVRTAYIPYAAGSKGFELTAAERIESVKGQTIQDFKKSTESRGDKLSDRVLSSLHLEDGDFVVVVESRKGSLLI